MPKNTEKRTLTFVLNVEATEGTTSKFFDTVARNLRKDAYVVDDVYEADPTDLVKNPGEGIKSVKLISVKFS